MDATRYLIVNADDFGQSPGVNRGIIEAHERGIATSASLMVRWPAAAEAAAYGRGHPDFSVGLHLDLGEWAYRGRTWVAVYQVVPPDDRAAVAAEVSRQLAAFRRLLGRDPTHLDSHQHVHREEPLLSILSALAGEIGAPLRFFGDLHYCGDFYGQTGNGSPLPGAISVKGLVRALKALPPGLTELACHPGLGDDLDSMYRRERAREVKALCDPHVRAAAAAEGIRLCSFRDVVGWWAKAASPPKGSRRPRRLSDGGTS
jgi:chitin disaccharide deacetylase